MKVAEWFRARSCQPGRHSSPVLPAGSECARGVRVGGARLRSQRVMGPFFWFVLGASMGCGDATQGKGDVAPVADAGGGAGDATPVADVGSGDAADGTNAATSDAALDGTGADANNATCVQPADGALSPPEVVISGRSFPRGFGGLGVSSSGLVWREGTEGERVYRDDTTGPVLVGEFPGLSFLMRVFGDHFVTFPSDIDRGCSLFCIGREPFAVGTISSGVLVPGPNFHGRMLDVTFDQTHLYTSWAADPLEDPNPSQLLRHEFLSSGVANVTDMNVALALSIAVDDRYLYWFSEMETNSFAINRMPKSGGSRERLAETDVRPLILSPLLVSNPHLFWVSLTPPPNARRVIYGLIGGNSPRILVDDPDFVQGYAADDQYLYWKVTAADQSGRVMRRGHCGGGPEAIAETQEHGGSVAVDDSAIYWVDGYSITRRRKE